MNPQKPRDHRFWFEVPVEEDLTKSKLHESLYDTVREIEDKQFAIHNLNLLNAKLYSNRELLGLDWGSHTERESNHAPASYTAENLVASVVDTVTALISKNLSKPTPVVKDADFKTEMAAQKADRFLYAELKRLDAWKKMQGRFKDHCWAGVGVVRCDIDPAEKCVFLERVMPDNLIVDQRECLEDREPQCMYYRRVMSVQRLKEMFPERADEIDVSIRSNSSWTTWRSPAGDNVVVIEAHKLPCYGPDGKMIAGKRGIVCENLTLLHEEFNRSKFPYLVSRWNDLPTGFYGQSLVEQVTPFQLRMNTLNRVIERSQDLMSVPRIFVEARSEIVKDQVDNVAGRLLYYRGTPPVVMNWTAQNPEIYAERDRIRSAAFEYAGVSQLSAQAKLPQNVRLDSSKALREYSLRENERFALQAQEYEQGILELAEHILMLYSELYGSGTKGAPVDESLVNEIDWAEVAEFFKKRRYVFQMEASSIQNMTPAAREDILNTWATQGIIDQEQYKSLLNNPDLEEVEDLNAVAYDDLRWTAYKIDIGEFMAPMPEQDLQRGIGFMQRQLLKRRRQPDVPEEVLDDYRRWIAMAQGLIDQAATLEQERQKQMQANAMAQMDAEAIAAGQPPPSQMQQQQPPNPLAPANMGPEGNIQPAVATTTQGVPVEGLI